MRLETGSSGFQRLDGPTVLPTTLLADLQQLEREHASGDVLEVAAACVRCREAALLCLRHDELVWPVTLFPVQGVYHSLRDMSIASPARLADLALLTAEPPGVRPPGHWMHERIGKAEHYRPLVPLLWTLAMNGPRRTLLSQLTGTAAYRVVGGQDGERPGVIGALRSAIDKLRDEAAPFRQIARWPGMSEERASRLLNGLYLSSSLVVSHAHPAARSGPGERRGFFGLGKKR